MTVMVDDSDFQLPTPLTSCFHFFVLPLRGVLISTGGSLESIVSQQSYHFSQGDAGLFQGGGKLTGIIASLNVPVDPRVPSIRPVGGAGFPLLGEHLPLETRAVIVNVGRPRSSYDRGLAVISYKEQSVSNEPGNHGLRVTTTEKETGPLVHISQ